MFQKSNLNLAISTVCVNFYKNLVLEV